MTFYQVPFYESDNIYNIFHFFPSSISVTVDFFSFKNKLNRLIKQLERGKKKEMKRRDTLKHISCTVKVYYLHWVTMSFRWTHKRTPSDTSCSFHGHGGLTLASQMPTTLLSHLRQQEKTWWNSLWIQMRTKLLFDNYQHKWNGLLGED